MNSQPSELAYVPGRSKWAQASRLWWIYLKELEGPKDEMVEMLLIVFKELWLQECN